jgi:hypothetical protein
LADLKVGLYTKSKCSKGRPLHESKTRCCAAAQANASA